MNLVKNKLQLKIAWKLLWALGVAVAVALLLLAAEVLMLKLMGFNDTVVTYVNQAIKILAILSGTYSLVGPGGEKGMFKGAALGIIFMTLGLGIFSLLAGELMSAALVVSELLMGAAVGALGGILFANMSTAKGRLFTPRKKMAKI